MLTINARSAMASSRGYLARSATGYLHRNAILPGKLILDICSNFVANILICDEDMCDTEHTWYAMKYSLANLFQDGCFDTALQLPENRLSSHPDRCRFVRR